MRCRGTNRIRGGICSSDHGGAAGRASPQSPLYCRKRLSYLRAFRALDRACDPEQDAHALAITTAQMTAMATSPGIPPCRGKFSTLVEALEAAAGGPAGMNFHDSRGGLVEALNYSRLAAEARVAGGRMLALGLAPGDRVGLVAETEGDFVRAFMGAMLAGLVPSPMPLPTAFGVRAEYAAQLRRIAAVADASAVILAEPYRALVGDALAEAGPAYIGPLDGLPAAAEPLPTGPRDPDTLAYLQFSSGTTGAPRGVAVTHRGLMANLHGMAQALDVGREDRGVSWLPFYHDMGLVGCMLLPLATQMTIDYLATRDFVRRPGLWPTIMSRARATLSYAPSFGFQLAAQRSRLHEPLDLSAWRIAGVGGDMVKTGNLDEFAEVFAPHGFCPDSYLVSYGMAELTLGLTFSAPGRGYRADLLLSAPLERDIAERASTGIDGARAFARCGVPLPEHEVEIRDDAGRRLADFHVGRVFARGPSKMKGYFRDPAATAEILSGDGWLETGDKGYLAEGELVITGRSKDLIIINGRNIWPQDIEWTLEHRVDSLREGGVAAFSIDDGSAERLGVVLQTARSDPDERDSLRSEADRLIRQLFGLAPEICFSRPGLLPRTSSGKLSRSQVREMHRAGRFER
jgi:fatty-acyl-CoA synthase